MTPLSIRLRLTVWYAAALLAGLVLFGAGMWIQLHRHLLAQVDTRLDQRMRGLTAALGSEAEITNRRRLKREFEEFAREVADGAIIQLRDSAGAVVLPTETPVAIPLRRPADPLSHYSFDAGGKSFRAATGRLQTAGQSFEAVVALPLDEVLAVMQAFRNLLFVMIPLVLAVASLGGYWLSRRALRPVDEITAVAKSISLQNLSQRVAVPATGDELERMAETWNGVLARLETAVRRIRQFTADASHELRTPLALIRARAELALRRDRDPEEYRQALAEIEKEAEHMTLLTASLLTMARADAGGFEVTLAGTDLNQLVESAVHQNQALAVEKGVRLSAEPAPEPALVTADASALRRLLLILIDNALKHTPAGGTVQVSSSSNGSGAGLSVADTGEGIPADALPHIFDRFYRADPARGSGHGFGLGLAIAQAIAEAHGTSIQVESVAGQGARFYVSLKTQRS